MLPLAGFLLKEFVYTSVMSVPHQNSVPTPFDAKKSKRASELACDTLQIEADAILALRQRLLSTDQAAFAQACALMMYCSGRIVVSGMGKSGHIGRKIAATLSSTGTPALFLHPGEAAHGDLGMVTAHDVFLAISYSGEAGELAAIVPTIKRMDVPMIAMTGNPASSLAQLAQVHLNIHVDKEALICDGVGLRKHQFLGAVGCGRHGRVKNDFGTSPGETA